MSVKLRMKSTAWKAREDAVIDFPDLLSRFAKAVAANDGARLDEKGMLQLLRQRLADYKVPKKITFLSALPRTATGKVLKTALRQQVLP